MASKIFAQIILVVGISLVILQLSEALPLEVENEAESAVIENDDVFHIQLPKIKFPEIENPFKNCHCTLQPKPFCTCEDGPIKTVLDKTGVVLDAIKKIKIG